MRPAGVAGEVRRDDGDARQHDEVAEGHDAADRADGDDVAEHREPVPGRLVAPPRPEVDEDELAGPGQPRVDHRRRPHRHRPVDQDDGGVQRHAGAEHAGADEAEVEQPEAGEEEQRESEERSGDRRPGDAGGQVERDGDHPDAGGHDARVVQVGAERSAQQAHDGAQDDGEEHGEHDRDGNDGLGAGR